MNDEYDIIPDAGPPTPVTHTTETSRAETSLCRFCGSASRESLVDTKPLLNDNERVHAVFGGLDGSDQVEWAEDPFHPSRVFSVDEGIEIEVDCSPLEPVRHILLITPVPSSPSSPFVTLVCPRCGQIPPSAELSHVRLERSHVGMQIKFLLHSEVFSPLKSFPSQETLFLRLMLRVFFLLNESLLSCERMFFFRLRFPTTIENSIRVWTSKKDFHGLLQLASGRISHPFDVHLSKSSPLGTNLFWFHSDMEVHRNMKLLLSLLSSSSLLSFAVNHLMLKSTENSIGRKDDLTRVLRRSPRSTEFYPTSYLLTDDTERQSFVEEVENEEVGNQVWLIKPSVLSEGRGMMMLSKVNGNLTWTVMGPEGYDTAINDMSEVFPDLCDPLAYHGCGFIAQRYVNNPLTWNGHKIGIRQFWLVASIRPLRVLLYDTGFLTFASSVYQQGNYGDKTIHLTNYDQQPDGNKPEFRYVRDIESYLDVPGWHEDVLRSQVTRIITTIAECLENSFGEFGYPDFPFFPFEMFAIDCVIDEDHRLWLNEVQSSWSVRFTGSCLKSQFMPEMLVEALRIVEEIRSYAQGNGGSSEGLGRLEALDRFSWIVGEEERE